MIFSPQQDHFQGGLFADNFSDIHRVANDRQWAFINQAFCEVWQGRAAIQKQHISGLNKRNGFFA